MRKTITVTNIDIDLLREQRNAVLDNTGNPDLSIKEREHFVGVVNLLDTMLDIAEGYDIN